MRTSNLLITSLFAVSILATPSLFACNITAKVKKDTSKSAFIAGQSFSDKQLKALATVCSIKKQVMNTTELVNLETLAYNKKIERLKNPKKAN